MKQLMTLERHTNVVKTPSKKSNFRNKKILPTEYVLKNQLGNSKSGKSEIDTIFENIKKLQVSKKANLKKGKPEESPKVSKNIAAKNFQEAIARAPAEPVSNCNLNRSSNSGSTKSLHWAKTPGTSPERKDTEVINSLSKVASDALPSINQSSTMVSSVFPSNSIAEKKKLIWEKEKAEMQEFGFYNPWGKSGCGAPIKDQQGNIVTDYFKRKGLTKKKQNGHLPTKTCIPHSGGNAMGLSSNCVTNDEAPLQQKSAFSPQHHETVSNMYPDAEENYNNSSNMIYHNNHSHSITAAMPTTITSTNSSQYETSTNNMAQNGTHERSHLLDIDEMRRREKEENIRKDIEYLEDLKNQIEANKRAKEQLSENQRRLDMEDEEAFRKHNWLLEQRESQQRQHLQQQQWQHRSFGQILLNSQTHHHQFMSERGANLTPTEITSANDSQYETSTNNTAQNGAHKRSHLLGMNAPIDEMRRREKEEKRRKDIEYLEDLKNQIEANKRVKEQLSENQRRLDMEDEEAFRKHNRLLEQRESQLRQHRRQSFGQIPLNSQTHHHQFMPETGANIRTPTPGKPQRGPMSAAELQQANYAAIEKARFEAERDKKVKKIRQLANWGHNISKLKADFEEKYGPLPNDIPTNFSNNNLDNNSIYNNINNSSNSIYNHNDNHNNIKSNGAVLGNNQESGRAGFVRSSDQDQPNLPTYHNYKSNHNNRYKHSKAIDQDKSIQEAYTAIEKARFEAERDKKAKRIRELAKGKFHDITKLVADYEEKYGLLPNDIPTNFSNNNLEKKHIYNHNDNHNNIESTRSVVGNKQVHGHAGFVRSSYSGQQRKQQQQHVIQQQEHSTEQQQRRQRSMQQQSHQDHQSHKQQLMQSSSKKENDIDEYFNNDNSNNYSNTNYNSNNYSNTNYNNNNYSNTNYNNNNLMQENNNFLGAARESLRKRSEYFERVVGNMHVMKQGRSSFDRQHRQQEWQPQQQLQPQKRLERHDVDCIKINSTEEDDDDDDEEEGDGCLQDLESAENLIPLVRTANALEERTRAEDRRGIADRKQGHKKHTPPKNPLVQRSLMKQAPKKKKSMK